MPRRDLRSTGVSAELVTELQDDVRDVVLRYAVNVDALIHGKPVRCTAPRLSALRKSGDRWLMVAHANFARIPKS